MEVAKCDPEDVVEVVVWVEVLEGEGEGGEVLKGGEELPHGIREDGEFAEVEGSFG